MSKTILVTGCSSGFGRKVSEQLARNGHRVYATMRGTQDKNAGIARELQALGAAEGIDLRVLELDVTSTESVNATSARILAESDALDVLINNAGQMFMGLTETFTPEEFTKQLDINVVGIHRATRAVLPAMRKRGRGLIINLSSTAGRVSLPFFGIYHASKWAVEGYTTALRVELASSGVEVVIVEPGPFTTSLFPSGSRPEDAEGRATSYPEVAHRAFDQMGNAFEELFKNAETPTDPSLVADHLVELIEMTAGTRPFRSVVGVDFGVRQLNAGREPHEAGLLDSLGLTRFGTLRSADRE